jgi:hypothetical protein
MASRSVRFPWAALLSLGTACAFPAIEESEAPPPLFEDPIAIEISEELDLIEVEDEEDRRCTGEPAELWGTWHVEIACHPDVDVQTITLRPRSRRDEEDWSLFVDRLVFADERAARSARKVILRRLPDPLPEESTDVGLEFTWCWHTTAFAGRSLYILRTLCSGSPQQHERASRLLLMYGRPAEEGVIGVRGYHSGYGHAVYAVPGREARETEGSR